MDFFARQDASRRSTRWLVVLFGAAFLAVAVATALVVAFAFGALGNGGGILSTTVGGYGRVLPGLVPVAVITVGILLLMTVASLYRSATLSRGGGQIATMLGGTRVQGDETDPSLERLVNVVEEMAIASGLPVPEIYVLEQEAGINAFAAGSDPADAAVAVTRGSLEQLTRAELQGVVAHEFSHILNGDMRLNLRLMGYAFGILVLSLIGRWLLRGAHFSRSARSSRGRGGAIVMVGLGLTIVGGLGVVLSRLIKAAVSRQREVLADASAVQFTREPLALAGALKKIGGYTPYLTATESEEVSHMLFGRAGPTFRGWFATHPPLPERIRALDPSFRDGDYPAPTVATGPGDTRPRAHGDALAAASGFTDVTVDTAGTIREGETATRLLGAIPTPLRAAAHSVEDSPLLLIALLLAVDTDRHAALLNARLGAHRAAVCNALSRELGQLDRRLWLPLVEIAVPALKRRPAAQIDYLFDLLDRIAAADGTETLFEYVLTRLLKAYLRPAEPPAPGGRLSDAWLTLLATVAAHGNADPGARRAALAAGLAGLPAGVRPQDETGLDALLERARVRTLDAALAVIAPAPGRVRRDVLKSIETTIRHDGRIGIEEAELLRAIGAAIGCPLPPPSADATNQVTDTTPVIR